MSSYPRLAGEKDALRVFGLSKQAAIPWQTLASLSSRYLNKFRDGNIKHLLVGQPSEYLRQLQHGTLTAPGGLMRAALDPSVNFGPTWARKPLSAVNAALFYGLPLYGVYEATKAPSEYRGSAVGSAIGGQIGGLLGTPLGVLGGTAASSLGSALGESLGRTFNRSSPHPTNPSDFDVR